MDIYRGDYMKIWGLQQILGVYDKSKSSPKVEKASGVTSRKDVVSISDQGKDFQAALKAAKEAPDIRTDKVEEFKKKVQTDSYEPSGADIADKIIKSIMDKKV